MLGTSACSSGMGDSVWRKSVDTSPSSSSTNKKFSINSAPGLMPSMWSQIFSRLFFIQPDLIKEKLTDESSEFSFPGAGRRIAEDVSRIFSNCCHCVVEFGHQALSLRLDLVVHTIKLRINL